MKNRFVGKLAAVAGWLLAVLLGLPAALLLGGLDLLRWPAAQERGRDQLVRTVRASVPGLELARLRFDARGELAIAGLAIRDASGQVALSLRAASVRVDLGRLLHRELRVSRAVLFEPRVHLRRLPDGRLNLASLINSKPSATPSGPSPWSIRLDELQLLDGAADLRPVVRPLRITRLDLSGAARLAATAVRVELFGLRLQAELDERPVDVRASGQAQVSSAWVQAALQLRAAGLLERTLEIGAALKGPPRNIAVRLAAASGAGGALRLDGWLGLPLHYDLHLALEDLRPQLWRTEFPAGRVRGELHFSGQGVPLEDSAAAKVHFRLRPSYLAGIALSRLSLRGRAHAGQLAANGELRMAGLRLRFRGRGDRDRHITAGADGELVADERLPPKLGALRGAGGFKIQVRATPSRLAVAARVDLRSLGGAGWAARGLHAVADASGFPNKPQARLAVAADALRVGAAAHYRTLRLNAFGGPRSFQLDAAAQGHGVRARLQASAKHRGAEWLARLSSLELRHPGLDLMLREPARLSWSPRRGLSVGRTRFALRGGSAELEGSWKPGRRPRGHLELTARRVRLPDGSAVTGELKAELRSRRLTSAVAARLERGGSIQLSAKLPITRDMNLDYRRRTAVELRLTELDLRRLAAVLPNAPPLAGRLSLTGNLTGRLDDPEVHATMKLSDGEAAGIDGLQLDGHVTTLERGTELGLDLRRRGEPLMKLDGRVGLPPTALVALLRGERRLPDAPVQLALEAPQLDLGLLAVVRRTTASRSLQGQLALKLSLDGTLESPQAEVQLATRGLAYGAYRPDRIEAQLHVESGETTHLHGGLQVRGAALLAWEGETTGLAGFFRHGTTGAPLRARLSMPGFQLAALPSIRPDLTGFAGLLQGEATLEGTAGEPRVRAWLRVRDPELRGHRLERLEARGRLGGGKLRAALDLRQAGQGGVQAEISADFADRQQPLSAHLSARALELDQLQGFFPNLRALDGRFDAALRASGSMSAPRLEGELQLNDVKLGLIGTPTLERVGLHVRLSGNEVRLEKLFIPFGKGKLQVTGLARLDGLWPRRVEAKMRADELPLDLAGVTNASFDGRLSFGADLDRQKGLRGRLALERGLVKLAGLPGTTRKLASVGPLTDVHYIDSFADLSGVLPQRAAEPAAQPRGRRPERRVRTLRPAFPVNLELVARSLFVRGKEMNAEFSADLKLEPRERDLVVLGEVRAAGGWVELLKRRYDIEQASVRFNGEPQPDPALSVTLTRRFPDAQVYVRVAGTARDPDLELSSDPPIYDRSQVVALILTGQPTMASEGGGRSSLGVASLVVQLVLGRLADAIAPGVGLDVLRVEQVKAGADTGPAASSEKATELEVGKYLTDRLYVGYRRLFGAPEGENANEGRLEYRISSTWTIESIFGDAGVGGLDLFWTHLY